MAEEQERREQQEDGKQAGDEGIAAPELALRPAGEPSLATPQPPASLPSPQRHPVWRWHVRRRRRKK
ncbi:MAG: hypothetical protein ACUVS4_07405 [Chloroflexaceae bacterium]